MMPPRWYSVSLRDLFWLILISALALAWWREVQKVEADWARYTRGAIASRAPTTGEQQFRRSIEEGRAATDEVVRQVLRSQPTNDVTAVHQSVLLELSRRKLIPELQERYDALIAQGRENGWELERTLVLTAIRRAQGRAEPVEVKIESIQGTGIEVSIGGTATEPETIYVAEGGNDLGGRRMLWHVQLIDEQNRPLPLSNFDLCEPHLATFAGDLQTYSISRGGGFTYKLPLETRSYITLPPKGRYQLQVFYALTRIAGEPDLEGLIYWQSKPVSVVVEHKELSPPIVRLILPIITIGVGVALCILHFTHRELAPADGSNLPSARRTWRSILAIIMACTLIIGGLLGMQLLLIDPQGTLSDRHAEWTMRRVD